jgi:DNA polymerase I
LPPWLSDALCRLSTGGGFSTRTLYANDEETLFDATRPVILNGITDVATRADLLDRAILLTLPAIPEQERRPEAELWEAFEEVLPDILSGLFGAVSVALREVQNVELASLPRLADFAKWGTAAEEGLGMEPGAFMEAYAGGRREVNQLALEADPVAGAVVKLMEGRNEWIGTASELLKELVKRVDEDVRRYRTWPKQPQHLSRQLKRLAPVLRTEGIEVEDLPRQGGERKKRLFKNNRVNDRHERHERHGDPEADKNGDSGGDGGDDGVTVNVGKGSGDRHAEKPVEKPDSAGGDDHDADDDEMQDFSKGVHVISEEDLRAAIPEIEAAEAIALDLETTGLDPRRDHVRLLSLATERGAWLVDNLVLDLRRLFEVLKAKTLIVHNAMYDLLFLRHLGYVHRGQVVDTMILSRMAYAGERKDDGKRFEHSLEACCGRELGLVLDKTHQKADWSGDLSEEMLAYAATDAQVLLPLYDALERMLWDAGQEHAMEIEERALLAGIEMAYNGVQVDKERWLKIVEEAGQRLGELCIPLDDLAGDPPDEVKEKNAKNSNVPTDRKNRWNWDSPDQIKAAAASIGLELEKTSMEYLKLMDHDFARALLAYKEVKSGLSTYGEKFFESTEEGREVYLDGRVYPSWNMCQADTGRMSCSSPNMQNVPKKGGLGGLRSCVVAPPGKRLIQADYAQIELRIVAKIAGERNMLEAFREGVDIHTRTALSVAGAGGETKEARTLAKALNFGLLYGMGAVRLRDKIEGDYGVNLTLEEAEEYRERWFEAYPAIRDWHRREGADFDTGDVSASSLAGRLRRVKSFMEKVNHPVQGTGADGLKLAMALFHERLPEHLDARLVLAVHDELVVECPEEQAEEVARFVEEVMVAGMDKVMNPGLATEHPDLVPIEVDTKNLGSWGVDR